MNGPMKDLRMSLSNFFITKAEAYFVSLIVPTHTKIALSTDELKLVTDAGWILTKRTIIDKVMGLFSDLQLQMKGILENNAISFPAPVLLSEPKISKGESYRLLPYVVLDYPRCFDATDVFAIRTMFWWGNFFSCTLHLSGSYQTMFMYALEKNIVRSKMEGYFICVNEDQWQHHFEEDNYKEMRTMDGKEIMTILQQGSFIKIARRFPLQQWNEMLVLLERCFLEMTELLKL